MAGAFVEHYPLNTHPWPLFPNPSFPFVTRSAYSPVSVLTPLEIHSNIAIRSDYTLNIHLPSSGMN